MPNPNERPENFYPPSVLFGFAVFLFLLAWWLPGGGVRYLGELAMPLSLAAFVYAAMTVVRGLRNIDIVRAYKEKHETFDNAAEGQGKAKLGSADDLLNSEDFAS